MIPCIYSDEAAVSEYEFSGNEVVDRQPVFADVEADAARRRQSADADAAVVPRADGQPVRQQRFSDASPSRARTEPHPAGLGVEDIDLVEAGEVDDDAPVIGRIAGDPVAAAAGGQLHALGAGILKSGNDAVDVVRLKHQGG